MVQTFLVVRCHACSKFQVDQEKKTNKWQCKVCGEKQSLQRTYARSHSAKDCRQVVQQYNTAQGEIEVQDAERAVAEEYAAEADGECGQYGNYGDDSSAVWLAEGEEWQQGGQQEAAEPKPKQQLWLEYVEDDEDDLGWTVAVPERAVKPKRGGVGSALPAGGGSKRQRRLAREDDGEDPFWSRENGGGTHASWLNGAPAQQQKQKQQQQQQQQQQHLLGDQNRTAPAAGQTAYWQQQNCAQQPWPPQRRQPQLAVQQWAQAQPSSTMKGGWQEPPQLALPQSSQPKLSGPQQPQQSGRQFLVQQQQAAAPAAGKWGGFVEEDDW